MISLQQIRNTLGAISFPGYSFQLHGGEMGKPMYLQATFEAPCADTGIVETQHTRKWLLSPHMTRSEIVQTAFKCVLTSIEHEAREQFKFREQAIFGPHFNVDELVELAHSRRLDVRSAPGAV